MEKKYFLLQVNLLSKKRVRYGLFSVQNATRIFDVRAHVYVRCVLILNTY